MRIPSHSSAKAFLALLGAAGIALALPAAAAAAMPAECQPLRDALRKEGSIAAHLYMTETAAIHANHPKQSESIYTATAIYVRVNGKWTRSRMTPQDILATRIEREQTDQGTTCKHLRDEAVNGEAAAVYFTHKVSDGTTVESTVWISRSRGLPLRQDTDIDVGGKLGKSHLTTRFEYGNVQAPPV